MEGTCNYQFQTLQLFLIWSYAPVDFSQKQGHTFHMDTFFYFLFNRIGGVIVSVLTSSAGDGWFDPWTGQTKDYKIGIWCFSAKHAELRSKSKDWLGQNQNNVSEWSDMSTHGLLFQ